MLGKHAVLEAIFPAPHSFFVVILRQALWVALVVLEFTMQTTLMSHSQSLSLCPKF